MKIFICHLSRILIFSVLFFGCQDKPSIPDSEITSISNHQTSSTNKMIKRLQDIYSTIDPMKVGYFENGKRAAMMKQRYDQGIDPSQKLSYNIQYGMELIKAGKNENAVVFLTQVTDEMRQSSIEDVNLYYATLRALVIAHLRVAETQNCLDQNNPKMCLMPLAPEAQFLDKQNLKTAIKILEEMLQMTNNSDDGAIWLLNFAHMAAGTYPDGLSKTQLLPPSAFKSEYDLQPFVNIAAAVNVNTQGLSGGSIMDDFNNDGYLDLVASSWDLKKDISILINDGKGNFSNQIAASGISGIAGGLNIRQVDYNNDGNLDIFVLRGAWFGPFGKIPNSLLKNLGDGTFSDVTEEVGLLSSFPTQTCVWRDFNLDGKIDLFIANESNAKFKCFHELYMQQSDGTFKNVISEVDALKNEQGFAKGCTAGDINNDGLDDIYISYNGAENKLFLNTSDGNNISFTDISHTAQIAEPIKSFPTWFWDYDNDGWEDILVAEYGFVSVSKAAFVAQNYKGKENGNQPRIYHNNQDNTFQEKSKSLGITDAIFSMGSNFGDLDNDGFQDFYLATGSPSFTSIFPNRMFRNNTGKQFQDVTTSGGFGHLQKGHGVSFGDVDNDGDQDVFCVLGGAFEGDVANDALFQNPGNDNSWITLKLIGDISNKAAIGARVKLEYTLQDGTSQVQYQTVNAGSSFGGNSLQLECGLSLAKEIKKVTVTWPNIKRSQSVFNDLKINSVYNIFEKESRVERI